MIFNKPIHCCNTFNPKKLFSSYFQKDLKPQGIMEINKFIK
ncbi:hypothetical protein pb186bvf_018341 [Paramecium bursaria]